MNNVIVSGDKKDNLATANPSSLIPDTNEPATKEDILLVISKLVLLKSIKMDKDKMVAITNELIQANLKRRQLLSAYYSIIELNIYGNLNIEHFLAPEIRDMYRARQMAYAMFNNVIADYENEDLQNHWIDEAKVAEYRRVKTDWENKRDTLLDKYKNYLEKNVFKLDETLFEEEEKKYRRNLRKG